MKTEINNSFNTADKKSEMEIVNEKIKELEDSISQLEERRETLVKNFENIVLVTHELNAQHVSKKTFLHDVEVSQIAYKNEMSRIIDDAKNAQFKIKEQIKILSDVMDLSFTMKKEDTSDWRITLYFNRENKDAYLIVLYDTMSRKFKVKELKWKNHISQELNMLLSQAQNIGQLYSILKNIIKDKK